MKNKFAIFHVLVCMGVCAFIINIRNSYIYPNAVVSILQGILYDFECIMRAFSLIDELEALKNVSPVILMGVTGFVLAVIGYIALCIFKRQAVYSYLVIKEEICSVIKKGLVIYTSLVILIGVFLYSIIGIPLAIFIIILSLFITLLGSVPVAAFIGSLLQEVLNGNDRRISYNYIIGSILMMFSINVYAIGISFFLFVFPVMSLGTVYVAFEKSFLRLPLNSKDGQNHKNNKFNRKNIRDIITKGI